MNNVYEINKYVVFFEIVDNVGAYIVRARRAKNPSFRSSQICDSSLVFKKR